MGDVEWLNEHGDFDEWRVAAKAQYDEEYDNAYDRMIDDAIDFAERGPMRMSNNEDIGERNEKIIG